MKLKFFFETHPVFNYNEFRDYMLNLGISRPESWRQQLNYHRKAGHLIHIRKFLYAVKPSSVKEESYWVDPYLIASKSTDKSIIGYHSALELHNLAYTTFEEITYLTGQFSKPFSYQSQRFRPVTFPKILINKNEEENNIDIVSRQGIKVKMTNLERTIVDILDRPDLGGGWEEIWRSLDHVTIFDVDKLINYTLLLNNATTVSKVGFFLESRPQHLAIDPKFINQLIPFIPKKPHYLNRDRKSKGKYFEKWQLIVPLEIIERQWEEPYADDI